MVEGAVKVAKNPLCDSEARLPWGVHVKEHLLDDVGDVGLGEGEALESPDKTLVRHHVVVVIGELGMCVKGVEQGLQSDMSACSRMLMVYWH